MDVIKSNGSGGRRSTPSEPTASQLSLIAICTGYFMVTLDATGGLTVVAMERSGRSLAKVQPECHLLKLGTMGYQQNIA